MSTPTAKDHEHISHIQGTFVELCDSQYRKGLHEHGGHLWEKPVDREALAEAVDMVNYMVTLVDQIDQVCDLARDALNHDEDGRTACLHILETLGRLTEELPSHRGKRKRA